MKLFEPRAYKTDDVAHTSRSFGERGRGTIYVWDERSVFAVQVAQATHRPLLLRGPAGSGKSSLAPFVANTLEEPFYAFTVTARTQARDMMWEFDALARLNDANVSSVDGRARARVRDLHNYLAPGPLWWAFDRKTASLRGVKDAALLEVPPANDPAADVEGESAVVLIDEIDKADPDVPNNLLEALGSRSFRVQESGIRVTDRQGPLVILTTNEERELPRAFLRRCVVLHLKAKTPDELVEIAKQHFPDDVSEARTDLFRSVARVLDRLRSEARKTGTRPPSTAEYLDALAACIHLGVEEPSEKWSGKGWEYLVEVALSKRPGMSASEETAATR